ncbi:hypothetical protein [Streptomyces zaomyceticus]|uniref:hypothetical protein n=1 Tax=Streptomyces zaomyceticus TaxID=68286 RepID=UPI003434B5F7
MRELLFPRAGAGVEVGRVVARERGPGAGQLVELVQLVAFPALDRGRPLALVGERLEGGAERGVVDTELPRHLRYHGGGFVHGEGGASEVDVGERESGGRRGQGVDEEPGEQGALADAAHPVEEHRWFGRLLGQRDVRVQGVEFGGAAVEGAPDQPVHRLEQPGRLQTVLDLVDRGQSGDPRHPAQPEHGLKGVGEFLDVVPGVAARVLGREPGAGEQGEGGALRARTLGPQADVGPQGVQRGGGARETREGGVAQLGLEGPGRGPGGGQGGAVVDELQDRPPGGPLLAGQTQQRGVELLEQAGGLPVGAAGVGQGGDRSGEAGPQGVAQQMEGLAGRRRLRRQGPVEPYDVLRGRTQPAHVTVAVRGRVDGPQHLGHGRLRQLVDRRLLDRRLLARRRDGGGEELPEEGTEIVLVREARGVPALVLAYLVRELAHRGGVPQQHQPGHGLDACRCVLVDGPRQDADGVPHVRVGVDPVAVVEDQPEAVLRGARPGDDPVRGVVDGRQWIVQPCRVQRKSVGLRSRDEGGEPLHQARRRRRTGQRHPDRAEVEVLAEMADELVGVRASAVRRAVDDQHRLLRVGDEAPELLAQLGPVQEDLGAVLQEQAHEGIPGGAPQPLVLLQPGEQIPGLRALLEGVRVVDGGQRVQPREDGEQSALVGDVPAGRRDHQQGVPVGLRGEREVVDEVGREAGAQQSFAWLGGVEEVVPHPTGDEPPLGFGERHSTPARRSWRSAGRSGAGT